MTATEQATITVEGLTMPDLRPYFKHLHWRPMPHSFGVEVASDWADKADDDPVFGLYKKCGLWTLAEAAILYNVVRKLPGAWVDIGAHTGWTTCHIAIAAPQVVGIDPMLKVSEFHDRAWFNYDNCRLQNNFAYFDSSTSDEWFDDPAFGAIPWAGFVIDGDHMAPHPLRDAQNAEKHLAERGVILFHDAIGRPVQEGIEYLLSIGFRARIYLTPHVVACCWRGEFDPPEHEPNPKVVYQLRHHLAPKWIKLADPV